MPISGKNSSAMRSTSTGTSWVLKKCRMRVLSAWLRRWAYGLDPVDALERHARILVAPELYRRRPISRRREEESTRVRAQLLLFFESVARVRAVRAGGEDSPFPGLDRLARFLVLHYYAVQRRLQRARRHRIDSHTKCVVVRPESQLRSFRTLPATHGRDCQCCN